jgi:adenine phosphoribosyltransferase
MTVRKRPASPLPARAQPTPRGRTEEHRVEAEAGVSLVGPADFDALAFIDSLIRTIPDFPAPGILFRDITPLLASPRGFHIVLDAIVHQFVGENISAVVGVESRGFIFGGALAARLNASFVPVRKAGKLPASTDRVSYSLEYGEAELEMHRDALAEGARVLIVDDLLATGGTAAAAAELVERQGAEVHAFAFVIELTGLGGRSRLEGRPVVAVLRYD